MAQVTSDFIWYPDGYPGPAYDLRKIISWAPDPNYATKVKVYFEDSRENSVEFTLADFETAMQAAMDATPVAP